MAFKANGEPCSYRAKANGYCGVHKNQAVQYEDSPPTPAWEATPSYEYAAPATPSRAPTNDLCMAYKANGEPCSYRAKANGYCGVHNNQAVRRDESPPPPQYRAAPSYIAPAYIAPSYVAHTTATSSCDICKAYKGNGEPCTYKAKENGYCGVHKNQAVQYEGSPSTSPTRSVRRYSTPRVSSPEPETLEICKAIVKKTGKPCTHPAKVNGYCGNHKSEAGNLQAPRTPPRTVPSYVEPPIRPPSVSTDNVLCKAYKGNGEPCTYKAKVNGYCGVHKNQAVQDEESPSTSPTRSAPRYSTPRLASPAPETSEICKAIVKKTGKPCTHPAKANGYCGNHKSEAGKLASMAPAPSTPSPDFRTENDTKGRGFGLFSIFGKKKETKITGRRGAMAEVLKICRTEDINEPER